MYGAERPAAHACNYLPALGEVGEIMSNITRLHTRIWNLVRLHLAVVIVRSA